MQSDTVANDLIALDGSLPIQMPESGSTATVLAALGTGLTLRRHQRARIS